MIKKATMICKDIQSLKNSITKGEGCIYGALAECAVLEAYPNDAFPISLYDYDMILFDKKAEIKACATSVFPSRDYVGHVALSNDKQKCDIYVFCRVSKELDTTYIIGYIKQKELKTKGFFCQRGQKDEYGFVYPADCWSIPHSKMLEMPTPFIEEIEI